MSDKKRILIVDNEEGLCRMMEQVLLDNGYLARFCTVPQKALDEFVPGAWDLMISDIKMPGMSGLELLQKIKEKDRELPVIMITAYATVDMSIQALRKGASDMLTKPFEPDELVFRVRNALNQSRLIEENRELKEELAGRFCFDSIVGTSETLKSVLEKVEKVAVRDMPVLVTGESGTGKELVAQAVHYNSARKEKRFIAINCGALPESILESELFGYRKGAFTGAKENRQGLLDAADGGTLFLDEVGNLPMNVQKTLLRFLQEKEFIRIGDTSPTKVDVRILSATNSDLAEAVKSGTFREDLLYRLNVVTIPLPPLRKRRDDIPLLAAHFINIQNQKFGTHVKGFRKDAMESLCHFSWPGNVRQLRNVVDACMAMESGDYIGTETLAQFIEMGESHTATSAAELPAGDIPYNDALDLFERNLLVTILRKHAGAVDTAARDAGMNMATMYRKIKKYSITREDWL